MGELDALRERVKAAELDARTCRDGASGHVLEHLNQAIRSLERAGYHLLEAAHGPMSVRACDGEGRDD